jgi:hypothetical protein
MDRPHIGYRANPLAEIQNELTSAAIGAESRHLSGRVHSAIRESEKDLCLGHILSGCRQSE